MLTGSVRSSGGTAAGFRPGYISESYCSESSRSTRHQGRETYAKTVNKAPEGPISEGQAAGSGDIPPRNGGCTANFARFLFSGFRFSILRSPYSPFDILHSSPVAKHFNLSHIPTESYPNGVVGYRTRRSKNSKRKSDEVPE